jgi:hypothetical protein
MGVEIAAPPLARSPPYFSAGSTDLLEPSWQGQGDEFP